MIAALRSDGSARARVLLPVLLVLAVVCGAAAGVLTAHRAAYGLLGAFAILFAVVVIRRPVALAVIALVGVYVAQRAGATSPTAGGTGGVAYSDVLGAAAALLSLPAVLGTRQARRLRPVAVGLAIYLACLLPTVFLHTTSRGDLEWFHRLSIVGGSLLVGAWIAREHMTRTALRLLVAASCAVAIGAIENTFRHGFAPGEPFGWNKNFIGAQLAAVIVVLAAGGRHLRLSPRVHAVALFLVGGGLLASQSRGGMLAAVFGLLVAFLLDPRGISRRARALAVLVAMALGGFAYVSIKHQLNMNQQDLRLSSIGVRFNVERVTRKLWRTSPITGIGLKYFTTGHYGYFAQAPNNVVDNELAESGVVGLIGFVALQASVVAAGIRRRLESSLAAVGVGVVLGLLLHGMVDIYWIAGSAALPFMILGMGLAWDPDDAGAQPEARDAGARHLAARA